MEILWHGAVRGLPGRHLRAKVAVSPKDLTLTRGWTCHLSRTGPACELHDHHEMARHPGTLGAPPACQPCRVHLGCGLSPNRWPDGARVREDSLEEGPTGACRVGNPWGGSLEDSLEEGTHGNVQGGQPLGWKLV